MVTGGPREPSYRWLPIPADGAWIALRFYAPKDEVMSRQYTIPGIERLDDWFSFTLRRRNHRLVTKRSRDDSMGQHHGRHDVAALP